MKRVASRYIIIKSYDLGYGGLQNVVLSQLYILEKLGYKLILVLQEDNVKHPLPKSVTVEILTNTARQLPQILENNKVELIIDHQVLYAPASEGEVAKIAKRYGVHSIAWIHNAWIRPVLDGNLNNRYLQEVLPNFSKVICLSLLDVEFYKTLGIQNVYYLPNPPSKLILNTGVSTPKKATKNMHKLLWVGRLHESTKQVSQLIHIMREVVKALPQAQLHIVGEAFADFDIDEFKTHISKAGLGGNIILTGPKIGESLEAEYRNADLFLNTSIIEGYPLTLLEANSYGLPIVMYELPWLIGVQNNNGIYSVKQYDVTTAADIIVNLLNNNKRYEDMSEAAVANAKKLLSHDFAKLYKLLLAGKLPSVFSPEPSLQDMSQIIRLQNFYTNLSIEHRQDIYTEITARDHEIARLSAELTRITSPKSLLRRLIKSVNHFVRGKK